MLRILVIAMICANSAFGAVGVGQFYYQKPDGVRGFGSAVCVSDTREPDVWVFITAAHNLEGVNLDVDKAYVSVRGEWAPVLGFERCENGDVALLNVRTSHKLRTAGYASKLPEEGEKLHVAGYPQGGPLKVRYGTWKGGQAIIPEGVYQGDSGCGLFNEQNEVVGILSGHELEQRTMAPLHHKVVTTDCFFICGWYRQRGWPCPSCRPRPPQQSPHAPPYSPPPQYQAPTPPNQGPIVAPKPPDDETGNLPIGNQSPVDKEPSEGEEAKGDCVTLDDVKRIVNESLDGIELIQGPEGPMGPQGETGAVGPKGEAGPQGQAGVAGKDGKDGRGVSRFYIDGDKWVCEYTDGSVDSGRFDLPQQEFGFDVVFEAGDDESEPERRVTVENGGVLVLPPQELQLRNIDKDGNQLGGVFTDTAPLGHPLRVRFRPPLEATQ